MSQPRRGPLRPGDEVGGFVIEAVAGRGGMGIVYRAHQRRPDRVVALKVIAPELADDPAFSARFERESTIAAQIEHPNVIPVHAVGDDDGLLFIAMRFIAGVDFGKLIAREGRLDPRRAVAIVDQVARALDAAHSHGLVHRDIKPANILLAPGDGDDHAYLTDFGLSRWINGSQVVTETGTFLGTIDYVAPEQARGERVDARTDVYSLGCVLFHALSGTVPFPRENDLAKLYAHGTAVPPSVCAHVPGIPAALDGVLMRAMAKSPGARYISAGDLGRAALAAVANEPQARADTSVAVGSAAPSADVAAATVTAAAAAAAATTPEPAGRAPQERTPARVARGRGAAAAAVASVLAIGLAALILTRGGGARPRTAGVRGSDNNGAQPATRTVGFRAIAQRQPSLRVQRRPAVASTIVGALRFNTPVLVVCTALGDPVIGPFGNARITTPVWDEVKVGNLVGYAPDAFIKTGTTRLVASPCSPSRGRVAVRSAIRLRPSADILQEPTLAAVVRAHLAYQAAVVIECTAIGDPVSEPPGTRHRLISPVWDRIHAGAVSGYVPDVFVQTPSYRAPAPLC